ncbi:MAG TPA: PEGA domain-containing protein, partial [Patescibacteria group bacterium]|nr:PEGA domain-containing protein [Patescibacteria group bacterium]
MDFLDPKKQKAHSRRIAIGYALIGLTLLLSTVILLYKAYGFDVDRKGRVIQNGLVFVSSQPTGADVYLNGQRKDQTNARMVLPAGAYTVELKKSGYRDWKRAVTVDGGSVGRFDYPFLIPSTLTPSVTKQYNAAPALATQSLDRRWLLAQGTASDQFDLFDLSAAKPTVKTLDVPVAILSASTTTKGWSAIEWGDDNRHVILQRTYDKKGQQDKEYILFDRQDPAQSQNLTELFGFNPSSIEMNSQKYDQYYLYDQVAQQVLTSTLKKPTPQSYLKDVLSFKSYGDIVLYATTSGAPEGKALIRLRQGDKTYTVRQVPAADTYLLQLSQYSGSLFIAVGAKSESKVYVYKDPIGVLKGGSQDVLVPVQILKTANPNYVSFSANSRFVMSENGDSFAVYDAETDKAYAYKMKIPIDAPQMHATWMDGFRIQAVSGGKLAVFEFDGANLQSLMP